MHRLVVLGQVNHLGGTWSGFTENETGRNSFRCPIVSAHAYNDLSRGFDFLSRLLCTASAVTKISRQHGGVFPAKLTPTMPSSSQWGLLSQSWWPSSPTQA